MTGWFVIARIVGLAVAMWIGVYLLASILVEYVK